ncbi:MAG: hypothetical protein JWM85_539 [Acidimicrobiaceae bacterium]|nr:hypothetical protein [Acidimicrobiaceae bacterium]
MPAASPESLAPALTGLRLSLHVLGAAVFVGGQLTLAGLLPAVRSLGEGAGKTVARAFARLQWPAYGLLLATGIWNAIAAPAQRTGAWDAVFGVKVVVALAAGLSAYLHTRAKTKAGLATFGALSAFSSLAALVLGVFLAS